MNNACIYSSSLSLWNSVQSHVCKISEKVKEKFIKDPVTHIFFLIIHQIFISHLSYAFFINSFLGIKQVFKREKGEQFLEEESHSATLAVVE
jgi:hypothetical protein